MHRTENEHRTSFMFVELVYLASSSHLCLWCAELLWLASTDCVCVRAALRPHPHTNHSTLNERLRGRRRLLVGARLAQRRRPLHFGTFSDSNSNLSRMYLLYENMHVAQRIPIELGLELPLLSGSVSVSNVLQPRWTRAGARGE